MRSLDQVTFRHLAALRAVAEERSFGEASHVLGYSQSAVSQQIAALEKHVGGPVFDRPGGPRPVEITPLGSLLLEHAGKLLTRLDAIEADLRAFRAGQHGALSVGTFQSVSVRVLPLVVREFRIGHADIELRLDESDDPDRLVDLVRDGELEVSFVEATDEEADWAGLRVLRLFDDPFVLMSPRAEVPATPDGGRSPAVDVHLLSGMPLVGEFDSAPQRQLEAKLRAEGVDVSLVFRSRDNGAIQAMVRAGIGHAVMPALAVEEDDPDVLIRRLDPGIAPRTIGLAWREQRTLSPAAEAFIAIADRIGRRLGERQTLLDARL